MSTPKVSIIMPSLNVAAYIRECIESAINQTLKDIEIICVDAGSTDGTAEILQEYAAKDSRVRFIHSDVRSYGYQMNLGLDAANGEYIGILETDDFAKPKMYETLYNTAKEKNLDIIKADYEIFVGEGETRQFTYRSITNKSNYYYNVINPSENLDVFNVAMMTWSGIYKASYLKENNIRHNESPGASYQDNGFWFQTFAWAKRVYFMDRSFYMLRRDNPNSSVHNRSKVFCIFDEYQFIENKLKSDPEKEAIFSGIFQKKKYDNCRFHFDRIGNEHKMDFLRRMADEFKEARAENKLDKSLFIGNGYKVLTEIMDHTEQYYANYMAKQADFVPRTPQEEIIVLKRKLAAKEKELNNLLSSTTYKIGKLIMFIPRNLRRAMWCCKAHGLKYTIKRALIRLHLLKAPATVSYKELQDKLQPQNDPIKRDYDWWKNVPQSEYENELRAWFTRNTGEILNLDDPKTFNEKIQWLKLYDSTPLKTKLADKYSVREWIAETIGNKYLVNLLGAWDSFDEIDFDKLPNQFALKANHASGWNIIVTDKSALNISEAKQKFDTWMSKNFAYNNGLELHYANIPHKIIAEEYIADLDGDILDYRFFCFNGKPHYLWVDIGSGTDHHKRNIYDLHWNLQNYKVNYPNINPAPAKPENLDEMVSLAEKLCKDFSFVRVDFYNINGKIYFGEMTFTPQGGKGKWEDEKQNLHYGSLISLPQKSPIPPKLD